MRKGQRIRGRGHGQVPKSRLSTLGTGEDLSDQEKILLDLLSQIGVGRALHLIAQQLSDEIHFKPLKGGSEKLPSTSNFSDLKALPNEFNPQETPFSTTESHNDWDRVLEHIQLQISPPSFETWLRDTSAEFLPGNELIVRCKNEYQRDWLIERYKEIIHSSVKVVMGKPFEIQIEAYS